MAYTYSASELIERAETLEGERYNWEQDWQRIADFILPRKNDIITKRSRGENRHRIAMPLLVCNLLIILPLPYTEP